MFVSLVYESKFELKYVRDQLSGLISYIMLPVYFVKPKNYIFANLQLVQI